MAERLVRSCATAGQAELHDETESGERRPCAEEEPVRREVAGIRDVAAEGDWRSSRRGILR
jgi:hypothetical protein